MTMHNVFSRVGGRSIEDNKIEYCQLLEKSNKITNEARSAKRNMSVDEMATVESLAVEMMSLSAEREKLEKDEAQRLGAEQALNGGAIAIPGELGRGIGNHSASLMRVRDGQPLASAVGPKAKLSRGPGSEGKIGELIRSAATGVNRFTPGDVKAVLTSDENSLGGYTTPHEWLQNWVDRVVEPAAMLPYTTRLIMGAEATMITTVLSRPEAKTKAQLAAFNESGITFGQSRLEAFTAGATMLCSIEMLQDSPNSAQQIERVAIRGLVDWFDRTMINGSGSQEPTGLLLADIPTTATAGVASWEMLANAVTELRKEVYTPNAALVSPAVYNALFLQRENTEGDGLFLSRPGHLESLPIIATTYMPDDKIIVADFTQLVVGFRENPVVEVSATAGQSFEKNAVTFRMKLRADWVVVHRDAFRLITGVTLE